MMIDNSLINWPEEKVEKLKAHYAEILSLLGEDPNREGLLKTPERVAKAMLTLTRGYEMDPREVLNAAKFKEPYSSKRHRFLFDVRTSHASFLREGACGLYP